MEAYTYRFTHRSTNVIHQFKKRAVRICTTHLPCPGEKGLHVEGIWGLDASEDRAINKGKSLGRKRQYTVATESKVEDPTWGFSWSSPEAMSSKEFKHTKASWTLGTLLVICCMTGIPPPASGLRPPGDRWGAHSPALCWPKETSRGRCGTNLPHSGSHTPYLHCHMRLSVLQQAPQKWEKVNNGSKSLPHFLCDI